MIDLKKYLARKLFCYLFIIISILIVFKIVIRHTYDANYFVLSGILKFVLFLAVVVLLKKHKFLNLNSILKNKIIFGILGFSLIFLSIKYAINIIEISKINVSNLRLYSYFFQCLSTGFFEEFFCRVLVFGIICRYFYQPTMNNLYTEAVFSSLIFAFLHFSNLFDPGYNFVAVLNQVMFAFLLGLMFQSALLKTNNIIFISILHGLINFLGTINSKLLLLQKYEESKNNYQDFLNSLLTSLVFAILIVLPMSYFWLKCKQNKLLQINLNEIT